MKRRLRLLVLLPAIASPLADCDRVQAGQRPASGPVLETSFEEASPGAFTQVETGAGLLTAAAGHAAIDSAHARSGRHCLHLLGGEDRRVELEPAVGEEKVSEITFWAERWTRRDPFVFRIESFANGAWREIYAGDDEIVIGGFRTKVRIPVGGRLERLRMTSTSPSGVLIDDLRLGRAAPMEIVSVTTVQEVIP